MSMKLGIDAKLYYRSGGNYASPTWTEISSIKDLAVDGQWDTTDAPSRASRIKGYAKTLLDAGFTGTIKCSDTDTAYQAIRDAFLSGTSSVDFMVLNGSNTTNGAWGYRYDGIVTKCGNDQGIQNALYDDIEVKPDGFSDNPFKKAVVTAGAPVFTAI